MSLILDALKKSEREQEGLDPAAEHEPYPAYTYSWTTDRRVLVLLVSVTVLVLLVVGLLILLLWPRTAHTPQVFPGGAVAQVTEAVPVPLQAPSAAHPTPPARRTAPSEPAEAHAERTDASSSVAVDPQVQALYGTQVDREVAQVAEPPPVRAARTATGLTPEQQHIDAVWREMQEDNLREGRALQQRAESSNAARAQAAAQATAEPARAAEPPKPAAAPPPNGLAAHAELAFLHDLSTGVQSTIPTMMYSRHNHAEGWVIINKKRLHEGDQVADGLVIEKLLEDGLILRMHDSAFRLAALNSWVNN